MKLIKHMTVDFFIWLGIIFGLYKNVDIVQSMAVFALWFMAITCLFIGIVGKKAFKESHAEGKMIPPDSAHGRYTIVSSIVEALAIAGAGYYALASIYGIASILICVQKLIAIDEAKE